MTRIGVIGTGAIARVHLDAWQRIPVDLVGYFDIDRTAAEKAAAVYGGSVYDRLEDLLAGVDMVDICTPGTAHKGPVLAAAAAGKAVICEKPLARTLADAQEMVDACAAAGVPLYVAHVVRFFPEFALAKAQLDSGGIGEPAVIRTTRAGSFPRPGGAFSSNYYGDFDSSGGVIHDVAIHDIDFHRWCFGEVTRVFTRGTTFSEDPRNDHALIVLRFENGAIGHIQASWAHPAGLFRTRLEIAGTEGLVEWDSLESPSLISHQRDATDRGLERSERNPISPAEHPYYAELAHFVDCYERNIPARVSAHDALMAVKVSLAAIESMRTGKPVDLATFEEVA